MKYKVYAVQDKLVGFGAPFISIKDEVACRDFKNANLSNPNKGDMVLYVIGVFDSDTGELEAVAPVKLLEGKEDGKSNQV